MLSLKNYLILNLSTFEKAPISSNPKYKNIKSEIIYFNSLNDISDLTIINISFICIRYYIFSPFAFLYLSADLFPKICGEEDRIDLGEGRFSALFVGFLYEPGGDRVFGDFKLYCSRRYRFWADCRNLCPFQRVQSYEKRLGGFDG